MTVATAHRLEAQGWEPSSPRAAGLAERIASFDEAGEVRWALRCGPVVQFGVAFAPRCDEGPRAEVYESEGPLEPECYRLFCESFPQGSRPWASLSAQLVAPHLDQVSPFVQRLEGPHSTGVPWPADRSIASRYCLAIAWLERHQGDVVVVLSERPSTLDLGSLHVIRLHRELRPAEGLAPRSRAVPDARNASAEWAAHPTSGPV